MPLKPWLRVMIVFTAVAIVSFFALDQSLNRNWALVVSFGLAVIVTILSSRVFRVVLSETIRYPRSFSDVQIVGGRKATVRSRSQV